MPSRNASVLVILSALLWTWTGLLTPLWAAGGDAILLEFSSPSCAPCQAMKPVVSELIARGVPVRQVDVARESHLARRYGIRSTPTYVVLNGGREVTRLTGMQTAAALTAALEANPSGPLIPTTSELTAPTVDRPQTRLTPLSRRAVAAGDAAGPSIRQPRQGTSRLPSGETFASSSQGLSAASAGSHADPAAEPLPSASVAEAIERAKAATVRLRVHEGRGYGAGTGTIIDTHGEEALVLTCGHLFRDSEGKGRIEVDLFVGGDVVTVEGHLVDYDADQRDIGLVAIRPGFPIQPVSVIRDGEKVRTGQPVFSFGCDRGDDPSRRDTRVTGVNKYNQNVGASNVEIAGAPIDGRSGGGLFDQQGRLIAVCNAADYKSDLGIYAGPGEVHWQLDRVQLSRLYEPGDQSSGTQLVAQTREQSDGRSAGVVELGGLAAATPSSAAGAAGISSQEVIVILRDAGGRETDQVLTLQSPDADLIARIRAAANR